MSGPSSPGSRRVTLSQVAARAGVSRSSVSYALNDPDRVAAATLVKVRRAMDELGYQTNTAARQLARGRSDILGLILPDALNPFFAQLAVEVELAAAERGFFVVNANSRQDAQREVDYVRFFQGLQVAGLLISPVSELPSVLRNGGPLLPFVLIGDQDGPYPSITGDSFAAGRLAAAHLLGQGRSDLVFMGGGPERQHHARFAGAAKQVAEAGRGALRFEVLPELTMHAASAATRRMIQEGDLPDGLFAANDVLAIAVLQELVLAGVEVPRQVSVIGYDDIPFAASAIVPLTTIRSSSRDYARAAVDVLLHNAEASVPETGQQVFPVELIVRQSSLAV